MPFSFTCVIPQDDTRTTSTTSNSFVNDNDDVFETNTTNRSNDSFVNDVTGSDNMYNLDEATYGDTERLEDFRKYSDASYQN